MAATVRGPAKTANDQSQAGKPQGAGLARKEVTGPGAASERQRYWAGLPRRAASEGEWRACPPELRAKRAISVGGSNSVVESQPSKLLVAGSIPVSRSNVFRGTSSRRTPSRRRSRGPEGPAPAGAPLARAGAGCAALGLRGGSALGCTRAPRGVRVSGSERAALAEWGFEGPHEPTRRGVWRGEAPQPRKAGRCSSVGRARPW